MILLISYNKNDFTIPLDNLQTAIQNNSISWWHHLNDTWIVRTDKNIKQFYNALAPNMSTHDRILIIEIKRNYQGWLNNEAWDWLNREFKNDSFLGI